MDDDYFKRDTDVAKIDIDGTGGNVDPKPEPDDEQQHASNLKDAILENAKGPKKVQGDSGSVEQHSLQDQIAAEKFLQSKKAAQGKSFPVRLFKISPDGTT